jgi:hypothetical protein
LCLCAALALAPVSRLCAADAAAIDALQKGFASPPDNTRPMVRWWWFGPAVVKPELEKEMILMKEGGFGGFEVQPTYPLATDGQYPGLRNFQFRSPEFYDMLGFTAAKAKELGLRFDLTLGSGWPYGGPIFTREEGVQSIAESGPVSIQPGQTTVAPPASNNGNTIFSALLGPVTDATDPSKAFIPLNIEDGVTQLPANLHGATQVTFFVYAPAGLMQVKRPALGAEGFIVDHYSTVAIQKFIDQIAEPEINACGPNLPYSIFCDSLEVAGEGWTPKLLAEFKQRRGYDLEPLLPALFGDGGGIPKAAEIRADYGKTVAEVFNDNFVKAFSNLAKAHNTLFRIQAYGTPPTTLTTYALADLDEGENANWKSFSGTRWASSANHLLGRPMSSSESFTWLHSPVFMAAPLDIKAESNLQLLNGVNQFLCHGWPYTAPGVEYPGWRFYAAAVFNEKNPWWIAMHDINDYLARASFMLRQGTPANDIALYLPEEDGYTQFTPQDLAMATSNGGNGAILNGMVAGLVPSIVESGYDFDFMDDGLLAMCGKVDGPALAFGDLKFKVIIVPNVTRIPLATLKKFEDFANNGGILIAVGNPPSQAPGYLASDADNQATKDISTRLFTGPNAKGVVITADQLRQTLVAKLRPDFALSKAQPDLGFVHRHTDAGEIYFLVNTSNKTVSETATFRVEKLNAEWWDPTTGAVTKEPSVKINPGTADVSFTLPPYGAQFLVFTNRVMGSNKPVTANTAPIDLSGDWNVTFKNASPEANPAPEHMATLTDWTANLATHYFSGVATYAKSVTVPATLLKNGQKQYLTFGDGAPATVPVGTSGNPNRADYQPPIGDAAVVWVNGQRAGAIWCPPYRVDVTALLKSGVNQIRIEVANRAVNYMADQQHHPLPDYTALIAAYPPKRFDAQDMDAIQVQPSGLLGPVQLTFESK